MLEKIALGHTGLTVSNVCFGTGGLTSGPEADSDAGKETARQTIRAIFDGPTNFLDTSRIYGRGRAEDRIGEVIRERGGLPKDFVLSTKLDRDMESGRFDAARARRSLEESLTALGLTKVQLLHLHDPEYAASLAEITRPKGAIAELLRMKEEGLCDAVGLAAGRIDIMMPLLRDFPFDALITHNRFTLLNRNAEPMIAFAAKKGMAVLNAAPYASGVLAKGSATYHRYVYQEATDAMLQPVRRVEAIAAKHGVPPGAAALQFSMRDKRIASTICGVTKPERVRETLEWAAFSLPQAAWDELLALPFSTDDPEATRDYKPG
jgi:D-threo-aldose 1-dehydrogenase